MLPASKEKLMSVSHKSEENNPLHSGNNVSVGGSVLPLSLTFPYTGIACTGELHQLHKKEVGYVSQDNLPQHLMYHVLVNKGLDQYRLKHSMLRDLGFEAAVDRIIMGIEKSLPGLSASQPVSTVHDMRSSHDWPASRKLGTTS